MDHEEQHPTTEEVRKVTLREALRAVGVPLMLILLVPALVGFGLLGWQVDKTRTLAKQNETLLAESAESRAVTAAKFRQTDVRICEAVNTITRRDRETFRITKEDEARIRGQYHELLPGLSEAQIDKLIAAAKANAAKEIERRPLLTCGKLPSQNTTTDES
jgi:hypothetical protein